MEPFDALTSRFEKATEMVLGQLAKAISLFEGAASQNTLRDRLIFLEKLGLIDSVDLWMSLREIRNRIRMNIPERIWPPFTASSFFNFHRIS